MKYLINLDNPGFSSTCFIVDHPDMQNGQEASETIGVLNSVGVRLLWKHKEALFPSMIAADVHLFLFNS
jgi:hypothetical protein